MLFFLFQQIVADAESGYSTAERSPADSYPSFEWPTSLVNQVDELVADSPVSSSQRSSHLYKSMLLSIGSLEGWRTGFNCTFSVYAAFPATTKDLEDLNIVLVGPGGMLTPMLQYTRLSDRIICTFVPLVPGPYTINAFYRSVFLIEGCPILLHVSRDYNKHPTRSIVDINTLVDGHSSRKPWGIACNTRTEQVKSLIYVSIEGKGTNYNLSSSFY